jgi:hypothetical protein
MPEKWAFISPEIRFVLMARAAPRVAAYSTDTTSKIIALISHKHVIKSTLTRYCSTATARLKISLSRCTQRQVAGKVVTPR